MDIWRHYQKAGYYYSEALIGHLNDFRGQVKAYDSWVEKLEIRDVFWLLLSTVHEEKGIRKLD